MRFVHTADLHLGRRFAQMSLERDNGHMLSQLEAVVTDSCAQALVVAGDVYDAPNPPETAARLWGRFITRMASMSVTVLVVAGNHDSGARLAVASELVARSGVHIAGELTDDVSPVVVAGVNFWLVPFVRPSDVRAWARSLELDPSPVTSYTTALGFVCDRIRSHPEFQLRPNVCVAHQLVTNGNVAPRRSESEQVSLGTFDGVNRHAFDGFDYVALGHVHDPQPVGTPVIRYAGSPLRLSVSEIGTRKSFVVVGMSDRNRARVATRFAPVEPLRELREVRGSVEELLDMAEREPEDVRNDFIHAVITDDDPVDVTARLRRAWPNLAQVTFDNAMTRAQGMQPTPMTTNVSVNDGDDMGTLFRTFFEAQMGKPMDDDETRLANDALEAAFTEGGDAA